MRWKTKGKCSKLLKVDLNDRRPEPEAVVQRCSVKKVFLKISQNSQENPCARVSLLIKLQLACNFIKKEALAQVLLLILRSFSEQLFL